MYLNRIMIEDDLRLLWLLFGRRILTRHYRHHKTGDLGTFLHDQYEYACPTYMSFLGYSYVNFTSDAHSPSRSLGLPVDIGDAQSAWSNQTFHTEPPCAKQSSHQTRKAPDSFVSVTS